MKSGFTLNRIKYIYCKTYHTLQMLHIKAEPWAGGAGSLCLHETFPHNILKFKTITTCLKLSKKYLQHSRGLWPGEAR